MKALVGQKTFTRRFGVSPAKIEGLEMRFDDFVDRYSWKVAE